MGNIVTIEKEEEKINIDESQLSRGDVLLLQPGDLVPADIRLIEAKGLVVDEFDLTGEIIPTEKKVGNDDIYVFKGSTVTKGNGKGIVIATGEQTEFGSILKQRWGKVKITSPTLKKRNYAPLLFLILPPFIISLIAYSNIVLISSLYSALAFLVVLIQNGDLFKYALTLKVIKKLSAQKIGLQDETCLANIDKADVFCFDKTGVLTTRHIEVKNIHFVDETFASPSFKPPQEIFSLTTLACALCNDVIVLERINQADPIDKALIFFSSQNGVNIKELYASSKRIYDKPFDSEERFMAAGFELKGKNIFFVKGDLEIIRKMCSHYTTASNIQKAIDLNFLAAIKEKTRRIDKDGDRTIAIAYATDFSGTIPLNYTFLCLVQFENPIKQNAQDIIRELKEKGIRPIIMTGDRPETALKVAAKVGVANKSSYWLTGKTMERMAFHEIEKQTDYTSVFARLLPSQKGTLVRLLQQRNKFVAMVGDGANDTIALKVADVGICFDKDSSPLARRVSRILINDLDDLVAVFDSSKRLKQQIRFLMFFRFTALIALFLVLYGQMLNHLSALI